VGTRDTSVAIAAVLAAGGAQPQHIVRMTWYVRDLDEYRAALAELGTIYREVMGRHYAAMRALPRRRVNYRFFFFA